MKYSLVWGGCSWFKAGLNDCCMWGCWWSVTRSPCNHEPWQLRQPVGQLAWLVKMDFLSSKPPAPSDTHGWNTIWNLDFYNEPEGVIICCQANTSLSVFPWRHLRSTPTLSNQHQCFTPATWPVYLRSPGPGLSLQVTSAWLPASESSGFGEFLPEKFFFWPLFRLCF